MSIKIDELFSKNLTSPLNTLNGTAFTKNTPNKPSHKYESGTVAKSPMLSSKLNTLKPSYDSDLKVPEAAKPRLSNRGLVPYKEKELVIMNTTDLFYQLFSVVTLKSQEFRGKYF